MSSRSSASGRGSARATIYTCDVSDVIRRCPFMSVQQQLLLASVREPLVVVLSLLTTNY